MPPTTQLKQWQNDAIMELLLNSDFKDPDKLKNQIVAEARVTEVWAQAYIDSFKANSTQGSIGVIMSAYTTAKRMERQLQQDKNEVKFKSELKKEADRSAVNPAIVTAVTERIVEVQSKSKRYAEQPKDRAPKRHLRPEEGAGAVGQILRMHIAGMSNQQIIEAGFNKSTVYRQTNEFRKRVKEEKV